MARAVKSRLEDPESLDEVREVNASQELLDFVKELDSDIQESQTSRSEWETRQDIYDKKRYGIRSPKTHPWPGAANFVLPQIDSDINRLKPAYIQLAFGVSPIVAFEPCGPEDIEPAKKRELLFDWRMKTQVRMFQEYCLGVDYALQRGYTLFKIGWKFTTRKYTQYLDLTELDTELLDALYMPEMTDEILFKVIAEEARPDLSFQENVDAIQAMIKEFRDGESTRFEMEFVEKADNQPFVKACDPRSEVFFPVNTTNIQDAPFIDYRFWVSKNDIKIGMETEKYHRFSDESIDEWKVRNTGKDTSDQIKSVRDGLSLNSQPDEMILLHEVCAWYDVDGDGLDERVIITYPDGDPSAILRFIELPFDHGMFPYVAVRREMNDAKIMSSRGIPALDDDFQTGISTIFNQDIDAGTIATTPTVVSRRNSIKNLRSLRYVPGQHVETENGPADYGIVQNYNLGQGNRFASMQYLKAWANDRIGNLTAAFSQVNNTKGGGNGGSKSATESAAISAAAGQLQSMDLLVWQMQMAEVYYQIDALYDQFGDEEETIAITNEAPIRVSRKEIQGRFNMVPSGRIDNSNPVLRANKALALYDRFGQNQYVDPYQLTKYVLNELDAKTAKLIMKPVEQLQQEQVQQQQALRRTKAEAIMTQLQLKSLADDADVQKEARIFDLEYMQALRMSRIQGVKTSASIADVNKA